MSNPKLTLALLLSSAFWIVPAVADEGATLNGAIAGTVAATQLSGLEGKMVEGAKGETIGTITAVDQGTEKVQLQLADGKAISIPSALLSVDGDKVMAPTTSAADVMAMAATQAGDSKLASEVSRRAYVLRHTGQDVIRASAKPAKRAAPAKKANTSSGSSY